MADETPEQIATRMVRDQLARIRNEAEALNALADLIETELAHLVGDKPTAAPEPAAAPEQPDPGSPVEAPRMHAEQVEGRWRLTLADGSPLTPEMLSLVNRFDERFIGHEFAQAVNEAVGHGLTLGAHDTALWVGDRVGQLREEAMSRGD